MTQNERPPDQPPTLPPRQRTGASLRSESMRTVIFLGIQVFFLALSPWTGGFHNKVWSMLDSALLVSAIGMTSLVFVLAFVGVKMLLAHHHPIPTLPSLGIISGILSVGVLASLFAADRDSAPLTSPLADELEDFAEFTWKQVRRIMILLLGATVLLVGLAMIVLPGRAILAIPAGLAILGTEFL